MPKPPGSGIKKGQKQKPRIEKQTVAEILANLNINVIHQLLKYTTKESNLPDKDKARIWMELMCYVYAKPRAELDVQMNDPGKNQAMTEVGEKVLEALNKWQANK